MPIADSWRRVEIAGIDPTRSRAPTLLADRHDLSDRWESNPLAAAAPLISRWLGPVAHETGHVIVVSDAQGMLLWLDGDLKLRSSASDAMNFVEGALWSEGGAGTNAIGLAIAADHPVQVHAAEHFSEIVHPLTCSAAPVHDPEDGRLLGIIDLTGPMANAHTKTIAAVLAATRAVEAELRARMQMRDATLRMRYLHRLESSREKLAVVSRSGRVIADHPDGFLRARRIDVPSSGGIVTLAGGQQGLLEPLDRDGAYIVRPLGSGRAERPREERIAREADLPEWRRAQLELSRLADEQAALRRVATLVAGLTTPEEIFATVAEEVARLLGSDRVTVIRYEPDEMLAVMAYWTTRDRRLPVGMKIALDGDSVAARVQQSGRPSRIDSYEDISGSVVQVADSLGAGPRSTIGSPIVAEGRVWGAIIASAPAPRPFPDGAELRLMGFAELVATAISNAVALAELNASRARIVSAADEGRRRIERDLHDGAQQRLATLALELRAVAANDAARIDELRVELNQAADEVDVALEELREIARGIHPAILTRGGLAPALRALSRRSTIPVELETSISGRLPNRVEATAYYVVSELLTNAARYSRASLVRVAATQVERTLQVAIRDDGVGGADPGRGSGLIGLRDRIEAVGGTIVVESPVGVGTTVLASLPLE